MDLTDDDFIEVPVMYEVVNVGGGLELGLAYNPGIQRYMKVGPIPERKPSRSSLMILNSA